MFYRPFFEVAVDSGIFNNTLIVDAVQNFSIGLTLGRAVIYIIFSNGMEGHESLPVVPFELYPARNISSEWKM